MDTCREIESEGRLALNRRKFLGFFSAAGLGGTLLPGALLAVAQDASQITPVSRLGFSGEDFPLPAA